MGRKKAHEVEPGDVLRVGPFGRERVLSKEQDNDTVVIETDRGPDQMFLKHKNSEFEVE